MFDGAFANPIHWIFAIIVLVLVFGANKLGDIGGALGKSVREFKEASQAGSEPSAVVAATVETSAAVPEYQPSLLEYRPGAAPNGVTSAPDFQPRT